MSNDAHAAIEERDRERAREWERGSTTARDHELRDHRLPPQELEYVSQGPREIDSRDVYEANADF